MFPATRPVVERYSEADVPTEYGPFHLVVYRDAGSSDEHVALVKGEIAGNKGVLVRVHSECFTGEVLHSLKCDCREQLDLALRRISEVGEGAVLYLRQEGRGIGLGNKIRAYALQEQGYDTVDANRALGFADDLRRYHIATAMLADLGVRSIALMTNNPAKVEALRADGVKITRRVEHRVEPNEYNREYLAVKSRRMGHLYDIEQGEPPLFDPARHPSRTPTRPPQTDVGRRSADASRHPSRTPTRPPSTDVGRRSGDAGEGGRAETGVVASMEAKGSGAE